MNADGAAVDFTSALYLGMRHPSGALPAWQTLTLGSPAALGEMPGARRVAARLARLQGLSAGLLGVSTLHLMWDLVALLAGDNRAVIVDAGAYAVSKWAAEHVRARAGTVVEMPHHDAEAARRLAARLPGKGVVIITDGYCPDCGEMAPVGVLNDIACERNGWLVCDDTQALGILGANPTVGQPYGFGGGGVFAFAGHTPSRTLLVTSLAKAFGAPVAALSGPRSAVRWFEERSETRMHCSPPSAVVIAASDHALDVNQQHGADLRATLVSRVRRFQATLASAGVMTATPSLFPIQSVGPFDRTEAVAIQRGLAHRGVRTVLRRGRCRQGAFLSFLITAQHSAPQMETAARLVATFRAIPRNSAIAREMSHGI